MEHTTEISEGAKKGLKIVLDETRAFDSDRPWLLQFSGLGLSEIWLVTKPGPDSVLEDIIIPIGNYRDLLYQFNGGLDPDVIFNTFDNVEAAQDCARRALECVREGLSS